MSVPNSLFCCQPSIALSLTEPVCIIEEQVWNLHSLPLKVRVGANSPWRPPGVVSLCLGSLVLENLGATQDMLGFGLCLLVAVAGGNVMACHLEKPIGQVRRNGERLEEFSFSLSPVDSCSSSELGKDLVLLYYVQRLHSRLTLHFFVDSFPQYWTFSITFLCLQYVAASLGYEAQWKEN